jgi:hypothetical protein
MQPRGLPKFALAGPWLLRRRYFAGTAIRCHQEKAMARMEGRPPNEYPLEQCMKPMGEPAVFPWGTALSNV